MAEQTKSAEQTKNGATTKKRKQLAQALGGDFTFTATPRTIFVGFPTPSTVAISTPFRASGTHADTTTMDQTAQIITPNGTMTGNLINPPDGPFTWTYEFTDP